MWLGGEGAAHVTPLLRPWGKGADRNRRRAFPRLHRPLAKLLSDHKLRALDVVEEAIQHDPVRLGDMNNWLPIFGELEGEHPRYACRGIHAECEKVPVIAAQLSGESWPVVDPHADLHIRVTGPDAVFERPVKHCRDPL